MHPYVLWNDTGGDMYAGTAGKNIHISWRFSCCDDYAGEYEAETWCASCEGNYCHSVIAVIFNTYPCDHVLLLCASVDRKSILSAVPHHKLYINKP